MPNEIELKYRISNSGIEKLHQLDLLKQFQCHAPVKHRLISIYYDTPDLTLYKNQLSFRVRSMDGGWFQAVKSAGTNINGLHERMEWEDLLTSNAPNFNKLNDPQLGLFADKALQQALRPIFTTDVERTEWQLCLEDNTRIEIALDVGELIAGSQKQTIQKQTIKEVEIELKTGDIQQVLNLGKVLSEQLNLEIENTSKAEFGCILLSKLPL